MIGVMLGLAMGLAGEPSVPEPEDIVVTGKAKAAGTVRAESHDFVRRAMGEPMGGQYARWNNPVCFAVTGLMADQATEFATEAAEVARAAGVPLAKGKCRPNIAVLFSSDPKALIARQMEKNRFIFEQTPPIDRGVLRQSDRVVRWWYTARMDDSDGRGQGHNSAALLNASGGGSPEVVSNGRALYSSTYHSSLIDTKLRNSINSVALIIDSSKAAGMPVKTLANYVAFVALSRTRMNADYAGADTILTLFDGKRDAPRLLTDWDKAFLAALYKMPPSRDAHIQRAQMAAEMTRRLGGGR